MEEIDSANLETKVHFHEMTLFSGGTRDVHCCQDYPAVRTHNIYCLARLRNTQDTYHWSIGKVTPRSGHITLIDWLDYPATWTHALTKFEPEYVLLSHWRKYGQRGFDSRPEQFIVCLGQVYLRDAGHPQGAGGQDIQVNTKRVNVVFAVGSTY